MVLRILTYPNYLGKGVDLQSRLCEYDERMFPLVNTPNPRKYGAGMYAGALVHHLRDYLIKDWAEEFDVPRVVLQPENWDFTNIRGTTLAVYEKGQRTHVRWSPHRITTVESWREALQLLAQETTLRDKLAAYSGGAS